MTRADNTHYLAEAAAERSVAARRRAVTAIEHLDQCGEPVTFAAVAATAGVSRSWLYRHEELRAVIVRLRPTTTGPTGPPANAQRASVDSIRQRLDAARDEVDQLRSENARLREQVARRFGEHRARG